MFAELDLSDRATFSAAAVALSATAVALSVVVRTSTVTLDPMFPVAWASAFVLGSRHQVVDDHQKGGNHNTETRSSDYCYHTHLVLCLGSLGPAY